MKPSDEEIQAVASIEAIPASLITPEDRARYIQCAREGVDCYAYHAGPGHHPVWNIWLIETRIACANVATSWRVTGAVQVTPQEWRVFVERNGEARSVQFHVHLHPIYDRAGDKERYEDRASRAILSAVQHINLFYDDIDKLNGCHF